MLDGKDGILWVGTRSNGLNRCRIEDWSCQRLAGGDEFAAGRGLSHFYVTSLFRDREEQLWVGTGNGGLNQVLLGPGGAVTGFRYWTSEIGLLDDSIMSIEQDLDGSLWLSTRRGLSRLLPETGQIINYVPESGLPAHLFNADRLGSYAYTFPEADRKLVAVEYQEFGVCIDTGRTPEVDGLAGRRAVALCYAAFESSVLNRPVTLDEIESERTGVYEAEINAHWGI